ncbi:MAG: hypothetical protein KatS3mg055_2095 [Chloroflexus sp.]|uniref:DUF1641 domain-containing protein n=1 Tax=Chloroflexus sp. TaxID=1904827 RepID=UPI0021DEDC3B|nr:DUF1641 domain-containing protein [Chloroflexus sp.]GIV89577.1 MAG: hypothetical protein KatS3mg055_2095 [Chloroflexus sp.]
MTYTQTNGGTTAEMQSLDAGHIAELLNQMMERMDRLEQHLAKVNALADEAPALVAMATDTIDGLYRDAAKAGVDIDERLKIGLHALERLTDPATLRALAGLSEQLVVLNDLAKQAPGFAAMTVDMIDELYAAIKRQGVDLEDTARQGLLALRNLVALMESEEMKALMNSGVLDPKTLHVMGAAAHALVSAQREPRRAGPMSLLGALFNRDVQRSLGFALSFAERFGQKLPG